MANLQQRVTFGPMELYFGRFIVMAYSHIMGKISVLNQI